LGKEREGGRERTVADLVELRAGFQEKGGKKGKGRATAIAIKPYSLKNHQKKREEETRCRGFESKKGEKGGSRRVVGAVGCQGWRERTRDY